MKPALTILKDCANAFKLARRSIYEGAGLLYRIQETNAWEQGFSSLSEYIEQECQLSKGYASKLLQAWQYYVVEGGVSPRNLEGIDAEKLYMALRLPGSREAKMIKAREWTRQEFRDEFASKDGVDCMHTGAIIKLCADCGRRI